MTVNLIASMEITNPERFSDYEPVRAIRWEAAQTEIILVDGV